MTQRIEATGNWLKEDKVYATTHPRVFYDPQGAWVLRVDGETAAFSTLYQVETVLRAEERGYAAGFAAGKAAQ